MNHRDEIVALVDASGCRMVELGHYLVVSDDVQLAREALAAVTSPAAEWTAPNGFHFRRPLPPEEDASRCAEIGQLVEQCDAKLRGAGRPPLPAALGAYLRIRGLSVARAIEACGSMIDHGNWTSPDGKRFVAH